MKKSKISALENVCRTCFGEESEKNKKIYFSIFNEPQSSENCSTTIMELLQLTTPQLNIDKDDTLPKILCESCVAQLIKVHAFQQMSIRAEERLREIMVEQKPTTIVPHSSDPLKEFVVDDILKIEMDEKVLDADNVVAGSDDDLNYIPTSSEDFNDNETESDDNFNYVPSSTDDDSEWEAQTSKKNVKKRESKNLNENSDHGDDYDDSIKNTTKIKNPNNSEINTFECDLCKSRLKSLKTLKRHKRLHLRSNSHDKPVRTFNTEFEKSTYEFECDECGSRLKTRKSLTRHKKIHQRTLVVQKEKPIKPATKTINECEYCKKVFQKPSLLKDHIRLHTGELPYLCSECGKSFRKASILKQHLLRHGTEKPHVCPDCPKSFSTISDLASHKAVHSKKKSHVCDVCGAGFVKPFYLKEHKMYHTGEKNHKCDYCDRRFVTGFQCRRHMLTHTGERPHKCKYCSRTYTQRTELTKHLRTHLGENVYSCSMCPRRFPRYEDLREHFNTHKDDNEDTKLKNLQALREEELRLEIKFGLVEDN